MGSYISEETKSDAAEGVPLFSCHVIVVAMRDAATMPEVVLPLPILKTLCVYHRVYYITYLTVENEVTGLVHARLHTIDELREGIWQWCLFIRNSDTSVIDLRQLSMHSHAGKPENTLYPSERMSSNTSLGVMISDSETFSQMGMIVKTPGRSSTSSWRRMRPLRARTS